jgi:low affinity Fe/Cu permease
MAAHPVRQGLTKLGVLTAHPAAFLIVGGYVALWAILEPETLDWHAAATVATWLMTLFIQRAEHRDTQSIQAKLDELLRSHEGARNELTAVDQQEPEDIEAHREKAQRDQP